MKKLPILFAGTVLVATAFASCNSDDDSNWDTYREWREANNAWLDEQAKRTEDGSTDLYFTRVVPPYDQGSYVLMHWFNDRSLTAGNLKPYSTSTVAVKYIGHFYNGTAFDSSYLQTDSIFTTKVSAVVPGWQIALQNMHVGDSCEVVIPYQSAYGANGYSSMPPYSNLVFHMKLKDIPAWEIP